MGSFDGGGELQDGEVDTVKLSTDAVTSAKIAGFAVKQGNLENSSVVNSKIDSAAVDTAEISDSAVTGPKIDLSDIAGTNITVDTNNDELDVSSTGITVLDSGQITATGGSSPAVNTTVNVSINEDARFDVRMYSSGAAFATDYAWNYDWSYKYDDSAGQVQIEFTVNWDTDPGGGNDVELDWELVQ